MTKRNYKKGGSLASKPDGLPLSASEGDVLKFENGQWISGEVDTQPFGIFARNSYFYTNEQVVRNWENSDSCVGKGPGLSSYSMDMAGDEYACGSPGTEGVMIGEKRVTRVGFHCSFCTGDDGSVYIATKPGASPAYIARYDSSGVYQNAISFATGETFGYGTLSLAFADGQVYISQQGSSQAVSYPLLRTNADLSTLEYTSTFSKPTIQSFDGKVCLYDSSGISYVLNNDDTYISVASQPTASGATPARNIAVYNPNTGRVCFLNNVNHPSGRYAIPLFCDIDGSNLKLGRAYYLGQNGDITTSIGACYDGNSFRFLMVNVPGAIIDDATSFNAHNMFFMISTVETSGGSANNALCWDYRITTQGTGTETVPPAAGMHPYALGNMKDGTPVLALGLGDNPQYNQFWQTFNGQAMEYILKPINHGNWNAFQTRLSPSAQINISGGSISNGNSVVFSPLSFVVEGSNPFVEATDSSFGQIL